MWEFGSPTSKRNDDGGTVEISDVVVSFLRILGAWHVSANNGELLRTFDRKLNTTDLVGVEVGDWDGRYRLSPGIEQPPQLRVEDGERRPSHTVEYAKSDLWIPVGLAQKTGASAPAAPECPLPSIVIVLCTGCCCANLCNSNLALPK